MHPLHLLAFWVRPIANGAEAALVERTVTYGAHILAILEGALLALPVHEVLHHFAPQVAAIRQSGRRLAFCARIHMFQHSVGLGNSTHSTFSLYSHRILLRSARSCFFRSFSRRA